jgi:hypothetical protein
VILAESRTAQVSLAFTSVRAGARLRLDDQAPALSVAAKERMAR